MKGCVSMLQSLFPWCVRLLFRQPLSYRNSSGTGFFVSAADRDRTVVRRNVYAQPFSA